MSFRLIKNSAHWPLAHRAMGETIGARVEIGLCQAWAELEQNVPAVAFNVIGTPAALASADFVCQVLKGNCAREAVSRLLRAHGFRKAGFTGSSLTYDRQPLYRKAAA
jgi:hypothetical protein